MTLDTVDEEPPTSPIDRATAALTAIALRVEEPFASAVVRARGESPDALFDVWQTRDLGTLQSRMRYRWDYSHLRCPIPAWAGAKESWRAWRGAEQPLLDEDPLSFAERLSLPILIAENAELLLETDGARAASLFDEAEPIFRYDLSRAIQATHSWSDTFALFCLVRRPRALARLHPFAVAIGASYATLAQRAGGVVVGTRFPLHDLKLPSASAHLASGLLALGMNLELVATLVAFVAGAQEASGGWGDPKGDPDVLTTLACASLVSSVDPDFDPTTAAAFFAAHQDSSGFFRALGPEAPWLTGEIRALLRALAGPFAARFQWPHLPDANRDHKTRLPFYAHYSDIARLFGALPGLGRAPLDLAFIDLAGFRAFNNAYGQDMGDAVLAAFAEELASLPEARAIRDGGDEFLVVGAPTRTPLGDDLDRLRHAWPARFRTRFGDSAPPVAPRILITKTRGASLVQAREELGRRIGQMKHATPTPGPEGALQIV